MPLRMQKQPGERISISSMVIMCEGLGRWCYDILVVEKASSTITRSHWETFGMVFGICLFMFRCILFKWMQGDGSIFIGKAGSFQFGNEHLIVLSAQIKYRSLLQSQLYLVYTHTYPQHHTFSGPWKLQVLCLAKVVGYCSG